MFSVYERCLGTIFTGTQLLILKTRYTSEECAGFRYNVVNTVSYFVHD